MLSIVVVWFRLGGAWFIFWSALTILFSLLMLIIAVMGSDDDRRYNIIEALAWLGAGIVAMFLGVRFVATTERDVSEAPDRLAKLRDRFEAWVNREKKDA